MHTKKHCAVWLDPWTFRLPTRHSTLAPFCDLIRRSCLSSYHTYALAFWHPVCISVWYRSIPVPEHSSTGLVQESAFLFIPVPYSSDAGQSGIPALIKTYILHIHTANDWLRYTLLVYAAVGGKGYLLHVHTAGSGKECTLHVYTSVGKKGYTLYVYTSGGGDVYLLHVHAAGSGKECTRETERGGPCRPIATEVNRDSGSTHGRVSFLRLDWRCHWLIAYSSDNIVKQVQIIVIFFAGTVINYMKEGFAI